jgi:dihydrofolate reductase
MAKLIYAALCSIDGYMADKDGNFDWAAPDEQVHAFINDLERPVGTHLLGRRMYEVLVAWETMPTEGEPAAIKDYAALWHAADKVVYSRTLVAPSSARTRIERTFDPEVVRQLKASADHDISIGGAELAGQAIKAGLVDEYQLFISPAIVGGGKQILPNDARLDLDLIDQRRFDNGTVYLRYRAKR